ncbi:MULTISPECIES: hypothetical protein [unclassified Moraxella]|uniref:hypothetical protein n=1 Tax=unclassified Moraxella TaxID=2685852 RepID=UPI002B40D796|nr:MULTISPECIES: hypothetical protein [unclassified Moraxella]
MKQRLTTKMLKLGSKTLPIILTALPFAMMSQAFAGQADCVPYTRGGRFDSVFTQVNNNSDPDKIIYFCARGDALTQEIFNVPEGDLIENSRKVINMGRTKATVNIGTSRIDVAGFNVNDNLRLPTAYIFRPLNSVPVQEIFHFVTYTKRTNFIKDKTGLESPYTYCRGEAEGTPRVNHYQNIFNYLKGNAHLFTVNGTPAQPFVNGVNTGADSQFAFARVTVDGADMTVKFFTRQTDRFFYSIKKFDAVYCLLTVGVQAEIDVNTTQARSYNLRVRFAN